MWPKGTSAQAARFAALTTSDTLWPVVLDGVEVSGNEADGLGGAGYCDDVTVTGSVISDHTAHTDSDGFYGNGGALICTDVAVTDSSFTENTAVESDGAVLRHQHDQ